MKTKTSIKLKFRPSKVEGKEGTLYFQLIHEGDVRQLRTGQRIHPEDWDEKNSNITTAIRTDEARKAHLSAVRDHIRWQTALLEAIVKEVERRQGNYSLDDIIERYEQRAPSTSSVFGYISRQEQRIRKMKREGTADSYRALLRSFQTHRQNIDLSFVDLTEDVVEGYEAFLKHRGLSRNTMVNYLRILRTLYKRAVRDGVVTTPNDHLFDGVNMTIETTAKRAISMADIAKLRQIDLSANPAQDFARNIFLLSFYLRGISFVDMAYLKKTNLRDGFLTYCRHKTSQQLSIRWEEAMQEIVDAMPKSENAYLLPIITREDGTERKQYQNKAQSINRRLKLVAKKAGISNLSSLYASRHSWASAARDNNIPLSVISSGMGHNSLTTTQIYLSTILSSKVDDANLQLINDLQKLKI